MQWIMSVRFLEKHCKLFILTSQCSLNTHFHLKVNPNIWRTVQCRLYLNQPSKTDNNTIGRKVAFGSFACPESGRE